MERVKKGEKYWYIHLGDFNPCALWDWEDDSMYANGRYDNHNYFHTEEEAEAIVRKIEAVLKGADVIEMPSYGEIERELEDTLEMGGYPENSWTEEAYEDGFIHGFNWLKSKIVK